uniref:MORN repeat-containing protein n=1 Tax=Fagus sylvatica TaxID=28930 RepID=A0A2N9GCA8_FAGSY
MANEEDSAQEEQKEQQNEQDPDADKKSSSSDSDNDSDDDSSYYSDEPLTYTRSGDDPPESENTPEINIRRFTRILESKSMKKKQEAEDRKHELWGDAPLSTTKPGWDPVWADEEEWDIVREEIKAGRDPPIAPFYVPYRKPFPVIPDNHHDISNPKAVVEELDRIEEFLKWVSYVFEDGTTYEGTVWDDLAEGKGVYVTQQGLVRYEGEWLQNNMEGHGVIEVDIPDIEPVPGSKLEAKMRAEGKIIERDYMTPEDKEWLEMDIEDTMRLVDGNYEIPFYENDEWVKLFGRKPEKGRYRYAGQWKHSRMHGCGVYEVNERTTYGRFYFGELLQDSIGCDEDTCALHAGIAEVAAAKARMFVNKPDGKEDVWMAPGFINQFYEVPDYWKTYVHEVDEEREMWLNSFYKAPLRLPMPAELEYWWSKDESPEFVLINKELEPDPEDPSKLIYTEDPLLLHTPTGRLINFVEDEKYGIRLFWQPPLKDGEDVDPEKAQFLPLGYDEFFGRDVAVKKESIWMRLVLAVENACKPLFDKLEKWTEEKKKAGEMKMKLIEKELELVEAELCLEEALEDMDDELKRREKEEEKKEEMVEEEEEKEEEDDEEEEEDEDDDAPSSFGSVTADQDPTKKDQKGNKPGKSPFSSSSLSFASSGLVSGIPSMLQQSFLSWKKGRSTLKAIPSSCVEGPAGLQETVDSVCFPLVFSSKGRLRALGQKHGKVQALTRSNGRLSQSRSLSQILACSSAPVNSKRSLTEPSKRSYGWLHKAPETDFDSILSLHTTLHYSEPFRETICGDPLPLPI